MVSTGKWKRAATRVAASSATIEPGIARKQFRDEENQRQRTQADQPTRPDWWCARCRAEHLHAREELAGVFGHRQAEEILDLRGRDQQRDAVGEADDDRPRNEAHRRAQAGEAQEQQDHAGHHGDHEQSGEAVLRDDAGDDHDERAGGTADLNLRSAQERNQEAADDGGVDAGLRRDAGSDAEGHGQGQGDKPTVTSGDQVGEKIAATVSREHGPQLRHPGRPGSE